MRLLRTLMWSLLALLALGTVFALYLRPDFMALLADAVWACF